MLAYTEYRSCHLAYVFPQDIYYVMSLKQNQPEKLYYACRSYMVVADPV